MTLRETLKDYPTRNRSLQKAPEVPANPRNDSLNGSPGKAGSCPAISRNGSDHPIQTVGYAFAVGDARL